MAGAGKWGMEQVGRAFRETEGQGVEAFGEPISPPNPLEETFTPEWEKELEVQDDDGGVEKE